MVILQSFVMFYDHTLVIFFEHQEHLQTLLEKNWNIRNNMKMVKMADLKYLVSYHRNLLLSSSRSRSRTSQRNSNPFNTKLCFEGRQIIEKNCPTSQILKRNAPKARKRAREVMAPGQDDIMMAWYEDVFMMVYD